MSAPSSILLNDGTEIPALGVGVFRVPADQASDLVYDAIAEGYRMIDTAQAYQNEEGVGDGIARAIRDHVVTREELYVTTKLRNDQHGSSSVRDSFAVSLRKLGLDWVDLFLIHWPRPQIGKQVENWEAMIALRESGAVRSVGVSNFRPEDLDLIIDATGVVPALNQIEVHPYFTQSALRRHHDARGVLTQSWSPLAQGRVLGDQVLASIAQAHGVTVAQIVLRWHLQSGFCVIPKASSRPRLAENRDIWGFDLTDEQVAQIDGLDTGRRLFWDPDEM